MKELGARGTAQILRFAQDDAAVRCASGFAETTVPRRCVVNGHYWLFAAGLTDVEVTICGHAHAAGRVRVTVVG